MNICKDIDKNINLSIENFIDVISNKYSINKSELLDIWSEKSQIKKQDKSQINIETKLTPFNDIDLYGFTLPILKGLCKERNIKVSGKKEELISRLLSKNIIDEDNIEIVKVEKIEKKIKKKSPIKIPNIIKNIEKPIINVRRNQFGNYEHMETHLVFNKDNKVFAYQNDDGNLRNLLKDDIELCKKFKFEYIIPENLCINSNDDSESEILIEMSDDDINEENILISDDELGEDDENDE